MNLENLEPEQQEDGSILLKDTESGEAVYEIPAGYMMDAAGEYSDAVTMSVTENEAGSWMLNVTADAEWINAQERELPVQIDPTLMTKLSSADDITGGYVEGATSRQNISNSSYGNLMVGYDSYISKQLRTYIQLRNLPTLPKNSVICGAMCYFYVKPETDLILHPVVNITARKVTQNMTGMVAFTWNTQPSVDDDIMDYRSISEDEKTEYVGWNITELIKEHYRKGNVQGSVSAFMLSAHDEEEMRDLYCAKVVLRLKNTTNYPLLQIMYRDTKGVEGYYTYQTHDVGNAGTAYVGDYNGQLTLVRPAASYESTIMSYGLSLVYNSSYSDKYFTNDGTSIHSKNFTNMKLGQGWKLSAQETVTQISLEDMTGTKTWLVYNDSDGTEHYFKQSSDNSSKYEDEDGLNLTITKSGSDFTMTDKDDNVKFFKNGYLTKITDAGGNAIHIVYNGGTAASNVPGASGSNRITSVCSQPKGSSAVTIFTLTYDSNNLLTKISEVYGNSCQFDYITDVNGRYQLRKISNYDSYTQTYVENVRYGYDSTYGTLAYVYDSEAERGMVYSYEKSLTGCRISAFREYALESNTYVGNRVAVSSDELRKTVYRDYGADRTVNTADDIITTYIFNSFGHTVNAGSKDQSGNLLGVTASVYGQNSGTSKKNNRLLNSVSAGSSAASLLTNGGFEKHSGGNANAWNPIVSGGTIACVQTKPRSGKSCYELSNNDTSKTQLIYQSMKLEAGKTYTASVYVNTGGAGAFAAGGGAYLRFLDSEFTEVAKGTVLQYRTDSAIDDGWQRVSVTFTPASSGAYQLQLLWRHVQGTLLADDAQMELGDAPGSFNHVYNGSFENGTDGWTISGSNNAVGSGTAVYGSKSCQMEGNPGDVLKAEQKIQINKSSDTTFLLSGWSKGHSIPDLEQKDIQESDKFWGMIAELKYTDGSSEEHYLTFNEYVTDWQYAAVPIVPKASGKTIDYAVVRACYFNNANAAYFDNISLTEEPAQTYKYNDKGDVVSVKSTGNGEESYSYDSTTQNLLKVGTAGSGEYSYKYENTGNKHLPTSITNDTVTMDITYDANGQATKTTLKNSTDSWKMESSAAYGNTTQTNGLLVSQTDATGAVTQYTYDEQRRVYVTKNAKEQEITTKYDTVFGRPNNIYQTGKASVAYDYANGNLENIIRGGYITAGGTKQNQTYSFGYDKFGNRTAAYVGDRQLADYAYYSGNGNLMCMSYGLTDSGLATYSYWYDNLDRVTQVACFDADTETETLYGYRYSADGNLSGITEAGKLKYTYEYDSLGRLIYSSRLDNGNTVLYTKHQYDTSDRLTNQSWQIGNDAFSESYTYSTKDGTLTSMTTGGDSLGFTYNNLKQLSKRTSPKLDVTYGYRTRDNTNKLTTNQVETVQYLNHGTTNQLLPTLKYTYDSLWNITKVEEGTATAAQYSYDEQNQLTKVILPSQTSDYVYDTYGNIRSKTNSYGDQTSESYIFSYEDSDWLDLLTKVSYTDKNGTATTKSLTYDIIGNPLNYFNGKAEWAFTWKNGRQLATAASGNTTITNTYDVDGIRETKTVNGEKHTYTYLGEKLARETYGSNAIDYFYDNEERPYKFTVKEGSTTYTGYFVLNLQGDVIAIIDSDGAVAVEYEYDAWGKELSHTTSGAYGSKLYSYNALKYRGYYYDAETGFYYVSSRYYDPEIGRFINADVIDVVLASQATLTDKNLYAYCDNNPIMRIDTEGQCWTTVGIVAAGGVVGALLGAFSAAAAGGNVVEGAIGGALTGVIGAACGLLSIPSLGAIALATLGGAVVDLGMQLSTQYYENDGMELSKINKGSIIKTGVMTGLGTAIPAFGNGAKNVIDAVGTALIWAEGAALITSAEIVLTNLTTSKKVKSVGVSSNTKQNGGKIVSRITGTMTTADYFRQRYNAS